MVQLGNKLLFLAVTGTIEWEKRTISNASSVTGPGVRIPFSPAESRANRPAHPLSNSRLKESRKFTRLLLEKADMRVDRSVEMNPSFALGWYYSGWLRLWAGQADLAIEHFATSPRLRPNERPARVLLGMGIGHFFARRFDEVQSDASPILTTSSRLGGELSVSRCLLRADGPPGGSVRNR